MMFIIYCYRRDNFSFIDRLRDKSDNLSKLVIKTTIYLNIRPLLCAMGFYPKLTNKTSV